jgi:hypothetical protein
LIIAIRDSVNSNSSITNRSTNEKSRRDKKRIKII